jgi:hypothetical protein
MDNQNDSTPESGVVIPEIKIDEDKLNLYNNQLKLEQNLPMAIIGGLSVAIIGAILWAVITVATEYQIGYMAIVIGFGVGYSVRFFGKGIDSIFGIIGALLALIGCVLGNFLSIIGFVANSENLGYFETLTLIDLSLIPEIMTESFNPMDILFYGLAIYEGYRFSFRQITEEEIIQNATV